MRNLKKLERLVFIFICNIVIFTFFQWSPVLDTENPFQLNFLQESTVDQVGVDLRFDAKSEKFVEKKLEYREGKDQQESCVCVKEKIVNDVDSEIIDLATKTANENISHGFEQGIMGRRIVKNTSIGKFRNKNSQDETLINHLFNFQTKIQSNQEKKERKQESKMRNQKHQEPSRRKRENKKAK